MLRIGSLFSGIGGLELGLEWAGLGPVVWQCENDPFCRSVLEKHWPGVMRFGDVEKLVCTPPVDLICGGFPCQDISSAGKGAGLAGSRSGLWGQFARMVRETSPAWVVVENVASGANRWVDAVVSDLDELGYATIPVPLSAQDVGAPHIRRRIFVVAHAHGGLRNRRSDKEGGSPQKRNAAGRGDGHRDREPAEPINGQVAGVQGVAGDPSPWTTAPEFRGVDDGVPHRVDRLRALGNAVVPQCAEVIGWVVRELMAKKVDLRR
jgi:DNA (cytosine-5)-methyltransferase 1